MEFEAEVARLHAELRLPGLAVGMIRGRELWWFNGYGFADLAEKTPVTRDTPFHLASLTKTFASTLLMQLVEQGKLDLDTPAATFAAMSAATSPETGLAYGLRRVCAAWGMARSSFYAMTSGARRRHRSEKPWHHHRAAPLFSHLQRQARQALSSIRHHIVAG